MYHQYKNEDLGLSSFKQKVEELITQNKVEELSAYIESLYSGDNPGLESLRRHYETTWLPHIAECIVSDTEKINDEIIRCLLCHAHGLKLHKNYKGILATIIKKTIFGFIQRNDKDNLFNYLYDLYHDPNLKDLHDYYKKVLPELTDALCKEIIEEKNGADIRADIIYHLYNNYDLGKIIEKRIEEFIQHDQEVDLQGYLEGLYSNPNFKNIHDSIRRIVAEQRICQFIENNESSRLDLYLQDSDNKRISSTQKQRLVRLAFCKGGLEIIQCLLKHELIEQEKVRVDEQSSAEDVGMLFAACYFLEKTTTKEAALRLLKILIFTLERAERIEPTEFDRIFRIVQRYQEWIPEECMPLLLDKCYFNLKGHYVGGVVKGQPLLKALVMCLPRVMPEPREGLSEKYQAFYSDFNEARKRVMLAHHLGIAGNTTIGGISIALAGCSINGMYQEIFKSFDRFKLSADYQETTEALHPRYFPSATQIQIGDTLRQIDQDIQSICPLTIDTDIEALTQKILNGGLVCITITSTLSNRAGHAEGLVFSGEKIGDKMVVRCYMVNRFGDKPGISILEVENISNLRDSLAFLKEIRPEINPHPNSGHDKIHIKLKQDLNLKLLNELPMEHQKEDCCTWILMKLFLRTIAYDRFYRLSESLHLGAPTEFNVASAASQAFYKSFTSEDRNSSVWEYVQEHSGEMQKLADPMLLELIYDTVLYLKDMKKRPVDKKLLEEIQQRYTVTQADMLMNRKLFSSLISFIQQGNIARIKNLLENESFSPNMLSHEQKKLTPLQWAQRMYQNTNEPRYQEITELLKENLKKYLEVHVAENFISDEEILIKMIINAFASQDIEFIEIIKSNEALCKFITERPQKFLLRGTSHDNVDFIDFISTLRTRNFDKDLIGLVLKTAIDENSVNTIEHFHMLFGSLSDIAIGGKTHPLAYSIARLRSPDPNLETVMSLLKKYSPIPYATVSENINALLKSVDMDPLKFVDTKDEINSSIEEIQKFCCRKFIRELKIEIDKKDDVEEYKRFYEEREKILEALTTKLSPADQKKYKREFTSKMETLAKGNTTMLPYYEQQSKVAEPAVKSSESNIQQNRKSGWSPSS